jgi:hypothetical protein
MGVPALVAHDIPPASHGLAPRPAFTLHFFRSTICSSLLNPSGRSNRRLKRRGSPSPSEVQPAWRRHQGSGPHQSRSPSRHGFRTARVPCGGAGRPDAFSWTEAVDFLRHIRYNGSIRGELAFGRLLGHRRMVAQESVRRIGGQPGKAGVPPEVVCWFQDREISAIVLSAADRSSRGAP